MPLTKLQFRPGINKETTSFSNEGGWFDCDKIRFRFGTPEKIGGWAKRTGVSFLGTARALHAWVAIDGSQYMGVGTHLKYYIEEGGAFNDCTPLRETTASGGATFSATNGSSTITVTDSNHGAVDGDFVTFSGAATLGGTITADVLNQEYNITEVVSTSSYKFEARTVSSISSITSDNALDPTAVAANASDSGNGGSSVVAAYQVNVGLDTTVSGTGWGAGTYGRGTWGSGTSLTATGATLRIWSHDNFGEDLVFCIRDAGIFYWDKSAKSAPFARAVKLSELSGADSTTPTKAKVVLVSDRDKHIIAFGCDAETDIGTQDPLLIRFCSQADPTTWQSLPTNTAGDFRVGSGSEIVTAVETKQQVLVFTDVSLHAMQFLGPPFTFGISQLSKNITIMSPLSAIAVEDVVYWMGAEEFYVYSGQVQRLPCTVKDHIFGDFNRSQAEKVTAGINSSYGEVWWFYPSSGSAEVDKYVIYNYQQRISYIGALERTVWLDRGINSLPTAAKDGYLYSHETGYRDGSTSPASAIASHIESSQMDIGEGDNFVFLRRVIPDITFEGSTVSSPAVNFTLKTRNFPGGKYLQTSTNAVTRSATTPVEQFTDQVNIRLRGRSFALRIEEETAGVRWRLGSPRIDIRPDGRR